MSPFTIPPWFPDPQLRRVRTHLRSRLVYDTLFWLLFAPYATSLIVVFPLVGLAQLYDAWKTWQLGGLRTAYALVMLFVCTFWILAGGAMLCFGASQLYLVGVRVYKRIFDRFYAFAFGTVSPRILNMAILVAFPSTLFILTFCFIPPTVRHIADVGSRPGGILALLTIVYLPGAIVLALVISVALVQQHVSFLFIKTTSRLHLKPLNLGTASDVTSSASGEIQIAHLTDLHLTGVDGQRLYSTWPKAANWPNVNAIFRTAISRHLRVLAESNAVLITGDVADTGAALEWHQFFRSVPKAILERTIIVPGNHDINVNGRSWLAVEDDVATERKIRLVRWLIAADRVQGGRTQILGDNEEVITLRQYLQPVANRLERFVAKPPYHAFRTTTSRTSYGATWESTHVATDPDTQSLIDLPERIWNGAFPMLVRVSGAAWGVVVLDSNRLSTNLATNAFGSFSREQMERLKVLLTRSAAYPVMLAVHHHFGLPSWLTNRSEGPMSRALGMTNVEYLCEALCGQQTVVILNGHRHCKYLAELRFHKRNIASCIQVACGASTTLGDDISGAGPGFAVYRCAASDTNSVKLVACEDLRL